MIYTSSHNNCKTNIYRTVSISGNRGKDADYKGECYPKLAPKLDFWKVWHENIYVINEEDNNKYYIEKYYEEVLSKLDAKEVYEDLTGSVLLCYEDSNLFCHRHIVAAWLENELGIEVPECHINNTKIDVVKKNPWIKEYLLEVMTKEKNKKLIKNN